MYSLSDSTPQPPALRFHSQGPDDLFQPIAFGFVTEQMCAGILAEREQILRTTPRTRLAAQRWLFGQYDPQRRADSFRSLLRAFLAESGEPELV